MYRKRKSSISGLDDKTWMWLTLFVHYHVQLRMSSIDRKHGFLVPNFWSILLIYFSPEKGAAILPWDPMLTDCFLQIVCRSHEIGWSVIFGQQHSSSQAKTVPQEQKTLHAWIGLFRPAKYEFLRTSRCPATVICLSQCKPQSELANNLFLPSSQRSSFPDFSTPKWSINRSPIGDYWLEIRKDHCITLTLATSTKGDETIAC